MLLLCKYDKLYYYTLCTFPPFIVGWWNIASTECERESRGLHFPRWAFPSKMSVLLKCKTELQRRGEEPQMRGAPVQEKQCIRMYDGNRNKLVLLGKFILMKGCSLLPGLFRVEQVPVWPSIWIEKGAEVMYGSPCSILCSVVWRWYENILITKNRFHIHPCSHFRKANGIDDEGDQSVGKIYKYKNDGVSWCNTTLLYNGRIRYMQ